MKNKQARQSARDVYSDIFLSAEINSDRFKWSFDKLRNVECGFNRSESHMSNKQLDVVSIRSVDL